MARQLMNTKKHGHPLVLGVFWRRTLHVVSDTTPTLVIILNYVIYFQIISCIDVSMSCLCFILWTHV